MDMKPGPYQPKMHNDSREQTPVFDRSVEYVLRLEQQKRTQFLLDKLGIFSVKDELCWSKLRYYTNDRERMIITSGPKEKTISLLQATGLDRDIIRKATVVKSIKKLSRTRFRP